MMQSVKRKIPTSIATGWSDVGTARYFGVPAIQYGPGSIEQAHKNPEFIYPKNFVQVHGDFLQFLFGPKSTLA